MKAKIKTPLYLPILLFAAYFKNFNFLMDLFTNVTLLAFNKIIIIILKVGRR